MSHREDAHMQYFNILPTLVVLLLENAVQVVESEINFFFLIRGQYPTSAPGARVRC